VRSKELEDMGMFNSILADLVCPVSKKVSKDSEIQIKWQIQDARVLSVYRSGDVLDGIEQEYNNTWIRTDYICRVCSKYTSGRGGAQFIKTDDQSRHYVFLRIDDGKICEILTEGEFNELGIDGFVNYW
jgi:hypothetical protein